MERDLAKIERRPSIRADDTSMTASCAKPDPIIIVVSLIRQCLHWSDHPISNGDGCLRNSCDEARLKPVTECECSPNERPHRTDNVLIQVKRKELFAGCVISRVLTRGIHSDNDESVGSVRKVTGQYQSSRPTAHCQLCVRPPEWPLWRFDWRQRC